MELTNYDHPAGGKEILRQSLASGKTVRLTGFGYNANLGGETLIFDIDGDSLIVSPFFLEDANTVSSYSGLDCDGAD